MHKVTHPLALPCMLPLHSLYHIQEQDACSCSRSINIPGHWGPRQQGRTSEQHSAGLVQVDNLQHGGEGSMAATVVMLHIACCCALQARVYANLPSRLLRVS